MNDQSETTYQLKPIPKAIWDRVSKQKIFFGHMSVGYNILNGVADLLQKSPNNVELRTIESTDRNELNDGAWLHSKVGKNTDPISKIVDFESAINGGLGSELDVAFLKLCYVDFDSNTDVDKVFSSYRAMIDRVGTKYPSIKIVHFTPPLTSLQEGPKAWIKNILGKPIYGVPENIKRNQFGELVKKEYGAKNTVFDLAAIESTKLDGTKASFSSNGKKYPYLVAEYTDDGGHLNKLGRGRVAEKLVVLLSNL
jgi:hypothetical protein